MRGLHAHAHIFQQCVLHSEPQAAIYNAKQKYTRVVMVMYYYIIRRS